MKIESALSKILNAQFQPKVESIIKPAAPQTRASESKPAVSIDFAKIMANIAVGKTIATPVKSIEGEILIDADFDSPDTEYGDSEELQTPETETRLSEQARDILAGVNFELDPSQKAAVIGMARNQYACLIGAAGTGKTSTTKFLLNTLINGDSEAGIEPLRLARVDLSKYKIAGDDHDSTVDSSMPENKTVVPAIAFVAFTGQATQVIKKNMPASWRKNCMTIHSLLGYAPEEYVKADGKMGWRFSPSYGKIVKMPWDIIIVDESSMVSLSLWHEMLDACKPHVRIYFIGDLNQLPPPIGQGILGFALVKWPVFELSVVHRQKDEAANRIVDSAWKILRGEEPTYDDPATNPNWRVINFKLKHDPQEAHRQIVALAKGLSQQRVAASVDPERPAVYDPWRDRILVQMNGYNEESSSAMVGQFPLNESLSQIFANKDEPRIIIDAKRVTKRFAVGYRVMATKNEPPNEVDRVTNGLTGKITAIASNSKWTGDWRLVGPEDEVKANREEMVRIALSAGDNADAQRTALNKEAVDSFDLTNIDFSAIAAQSSTPEERQSGPASHIVSIQFDNGAIRDYNLNADIEQLQIAYASTTHKAQGAEMPTVIIVVHHASRRMLCRENLYTAITRASQRVIILDTEFGMRIALTTQKIYGKTLAEKVKQYNRLMGEGDPSSALMNVRLSVEGSYDGASSFNEAVSTGLQAGR